MRDLAEHIGRVEQRLGWDAAPVQTDAAKVLALDHCRVEAELGGSDCRDVAAGAAADDDAIVMCRHTSSL